MKDKFTYMTTAPIPKLVSSLAVPTIISMLITAFYNMADTYFVGKINTQATAAVGIAFSVMAIIQALGFFFGHGSGNYISRKLGAKDTGNAERMAATGFFCALLAGIGVTVIGLTFLTPIARLLGSTPTILPYSEHYLGITLLGAPFMAASLVLNNQMRFQGNAVYAMVGITLGAVLNVGLDPLLIFTFGMGIQGAAIATVFSQLCSFILLLFMERRGNNIRIQWRNFTGYQPVCGFNYGAGLYGRVREGFWFCVRVGTLFLLVCSVLGYIFAPEIVELFRKGDPMVTQVGTNALRWQLISLPLSAWIMLCNMMLQTIRRPIPATILAASRQGLFFIPFIWLLPIWFGLQGVEMSQAWADVCSALLAIPLAGKVLQEMKKKGG